MTAIPSQVLLIWVRFELQAARSGRRAASHPSDSRASVEELERLATLLQAQVPQADELR